MDKESPLSLQDKFMTTGIKEDGIISCKVDFFFFLILLMCLTAYFVDKNQAGGWSDHPGCLRRWLFNSSCHCEACKQVHTKEN